MASLRSGAAAGWNRVGQGNQIFRDIESVRKRLRPNTGDLLWRAMDPSHVSLSGRYMINAAGEAIVDVDFKVKFLEQPIISFGFEMGENEVYVPGHMAQASAVILDWKTIDHAPITRFYTGFTVGTVTEGPSYQKMVGTWTASGVALTDPVYHDLFDRKYTVEV